MLFVAGTIFLGVFHRRLVGDFDRALDAEAEMLARNAERKGRTILWDLPDSYSAGSRQNVDPHYCQLFLDGGMVVGVSQTLGANNLRCLDGIPHAVWSETLPNGQRGRLVQLRFPPTTDPRETEPSPDDLREQTFVIPADLDPTNVQLMVVVGRSRESLDALLRSLYLAGGAVAVLLSCAVAWLVRRAITRSLRPLDEMNAQISAIAPDALATRLRVTAPPVELAAVETAVNHLLERVERAFEKERRFSSDLAHELRTPIAELRTACEVGERWPEDAESTRQFFHDTRAIALQLEKIVGTLLALSRCEEGHAPAQTAPIHVQALVQACWRNVAVGADEKRLRFAEHILPELVVESDADQLALILRNLMENAAAHSEPATLVECSAERTPDGVVLRLVNTARDLERADLDHLFDRFWRKEASRTDRRHAGLGLSIARSLCAALGVRLFVELHEGQRFEARLLFPNIGPAAEKSKPH